MSTTPVPMKDSSEPKTKPVEMKLEVIVIPVSDVDRAKEFYSKLGWRLDADFPISDALRVVQFTPPGSSCSIHFGKGVTPAPPGSAQGLYLIVSDIVATRAELVSRGIEVNDIVHRDVPGPARLAGPHPERRSYASFASLKDPDGNSWLFQEVTQRLPGRVDSASTTYTSANELASAMIRAATAHGEHEKRNGGQRDENWPEWYASYMVAEQTGAALPK